MPRIPSFLVTQKKKLAQQQAKKEADRKQRNIETYEREKAARQAKGSVVRASEIPSMYQTTGSRMRTFESFMQEVKERMCQSPN